MKKTEILAVVPARGGSKGIKRKNLYPVNGKPLIQYTIEAGLNSDMISRLIVNSEDKEIIEFAKKQGIEVFVRPEKFAQDTTPMKDVLMHQLAFLREKEGYQPDYLVLLQPTSPLRTSEHIDEALKVMIDSGCDALVSVEETPHLHSPYSVMKLNEEGNLEFFISEGQKYTCRQDKPKFFSRNGAAIYAVKTDTYLETESLYGTKCAPYVMASEDSIDIDSLKDVYLVEAMMRYKKDNG